MLRKYADEEEVDENTCIPNRKARKRKCEQRWSEEVRSKKTLDLHAAVKKWLNEEKYVNDHGDRRGASLKFKFRTRSAGLRAEVGGWKNKEEARQCVMCSKGEKESVHRTRLAEMYSIYKSEREQLWELMEAECGLGEEWGWLEEEEKVKVLLGQDMERGERIDRSVKSNLRKVMNKRRRWMGLGTRIQ